MNIRKALYEFRKPGIVVHELAHLFAVFIVPNVEVTDFDLLEEVNYEGHLTGIRSLIISIAPAVINTLLASLLFTVTLNLIGSQQTIAKTVGGFIISVLAFILGMSIASNAILSYQDARSPISVIYEQLFTIRFPIVLLFGPIIIGICIPFLIIGYIIEKSPLLLDVIPLLYASILFLIVYLL